MSDKKYRQTVLIELEGPDMAAVYNARLKLERAISELTRELGRLKNAGYVLAIIPDREIREWNPAAPKAPG